jgi:sugar phosphate isomerase/epimerase
MKRLFIGSTLCYGVTWQSLGWEYLGKAGVKNIEIDLQQLYGSCVLVPELMFDEPWHGMWQISIPDLKDKLKSLGVKATSVIANTEIFYRKGVDLLKVRMEFCKKMGIKYVVAAPWPHKSVPGAQRIVYDHWKEICDYAEMLDLELSVETHGWTMNNAKECLKTIKNVNRKNFKVCFNTADTYYRNKGLDSAEEVKLLGEHIGSVFLKDFKGEKGIWNHVALGEGMVDYSKVFSILDGFGFKGPYIFQLEGGPTTPNFTMEQYQEKLVNSINHLKDIGVWENG